MNWIRIFSYAGLALLVFPVIFILYEGFGPLRNPTGYSDVVFKSIELSVFASAITALICIVLFTPLAYHLARNRNHAAETLADIPASIPHPIVGIAVLIIASTNNPFGQLLQRLGINLFDSILGLVVALTIVSAPIYIKSMQPFFQSMSSSPENFSLGLGASKSKTFLFVVLPRSRKGILTASLIAMSRALSEYGAIVFVAYAIFYQPYAGFFGVSPASVLIFNFFSSSGLAGAAPTASAVMIIVSIILMVGLRIVNR
jgi:molybdate/tungstate transport system permease protein